MTYKEFVLDTFIKHHNCVGKYEDWELQEIIEVTPFNNIERWLIKVGYNLISY